MTGAVRSGDIIAAIATAPGRAALALVRISGDRVADVVAPLVRPWPRDARRATHARVHDAEGEVLDDVVVVRYDAPHSFTGEDAVEITCHGGPFSPALIMAALARAGVRPAEPGEFTRRAVLNGRLDLLQAEAIGDLVDAGSRAAQRVAIAQLDGGLSRRIARLREDVLQVEALAAYDIDFPEEDDGPVPRQRILAATDALVDALDDLIATSGFGEMVRAGAVVVICGAPNVGKSSLFNALLRTRRAIVTDVPGTTRDAIEAVTEMEGWPVRLVDTAGMRESSDAVERLGIEISRDYAARADVLVVCGDDEATLAAARATVAALGRAPTVAVRSKADLREASAKANEPGVLDVSAETGAGLPQLSRAIAAQLEHRAGPLQLDAPIVTRERHRLALEQARDELARFRAAFGGDDVPAVVAAVHLRAATRHLEELIGSVDVEQVLDRVFSAFCIGK